MVITISTTQRPATDLGHLLRKHPAKTHVFNLNYRRAHVFYPAATDERCTVKFLPVGPEDSELSSPTQMGGFEKKDS